MNALRTILPLALAAFFIYKGTRSRIYLLGIPFLMYMRSAVFFENARPFWMPGRLEAETHVLIWLFVVWLLCTDLLLPAGRRGGRFRPFGGRISLPEEALLVVVAAYAMLRLGLTVLAYGDPGAALGEARSFAYLFVGYLLIRGIVSTASLAEILAFVRALVILNTGAAVLFVLHQAVNLPIYAGAEYYTTTFLGQTITRTFYFMPQLLPLSIAYLFARRQWNVWTVLAALVNLAAVWISYTRSLVLIVALIIAICLLARALKGGQAALVLRRTVGVALVLLVLMVGLAQFFPVQSQFFLGRLNEAAAAPSVTSIGNVENRQNKVRTTYRSIARRDATLGAGWVTASQDPMVATVEDMQADIVWVPILYRLGLVGVALVVVAFAAYVWRAARLVASPSGDVELFAIIWLGVIVGLFLEGFISWTFMQPGRHAMALWALAFLGAVASMVRSAPSDAEQSQPVAL